MMGMLPTSMRAMQTDVTRPRTARTVRRLCWIAILSRRSVIGNGAGLAPRVCRLAHLSERPHDVSRSGRALVAVAPATGGNRRSGRHRARIRRVFHRVRARIRESSARFHCASAFCRNGRRIAGRTRRRRNDARGGASDHMAVARPDALCRFAARYNLGVLFSSPRWPRDARSSATMLRF